MGIIAGFKLTFDDSTVFRATESVQITHRTEPLFLLDARGNFITLANEYLTGGGQPGRADSNYSGVFYGFGAGVHTIQINFLQYEGNTETWGNASSGDSAITKMHELNRHITTSRADSEAVALLEVGEYNETNGSYNAIPVAVGESDLSYNQEEDVSDFSGSVTFYDAIDVAQSVSSGARGGE